MGSGAPLWYIAHGCHCLAYHTGIYGSNIPWPVSSHRRNVPICCNHRGAILTLKRFMMISITLLHQSCASAHYLESPTATAQAQVHTLWFLSGA